jgi:hypothetical protein
MRNAAVSSLSNGLPAESADVLKVITQVITYHIQITTVIGSSSRQNEKLIGVLAVSGGKS